MPMLFILCLYRCLVFALFMLILFLLTESRLSQNNQPHTIRFILLLCPQQCYFNFLSTIRILFKNQLEPLKLFITATKSFAERNWSNNKKCTVVVRSNQTTDLCHWINSLLSFRCFIGSFTSGVRLKIYQPPL